MRKNITPLLAIAFVVAIISTGLFYGLFASKLSQASTDLPWQNVLIASRKLAPGAVLAGPDVHVAEFRGRTAFAGSFAAPEQVIGSTTTEPLEENQVLTKSSLVSRTPADGTSIPVGMRALTIHVFESSGVMALLRPGSRVDVQAVSDRDHSTVLRTILQSVEVLSAGAQTEPLAGRPPAYAVTVLVRPEAADLLAIADTGARLRLTLRNRLDAGLVESGAPPSALAMASVFSRTRQRSARATRE